MAVTVTGTPVAITSTSQSVTVPADAKAAIFTWSYWNASAGQGLASATLNGASPDAVLEAATGAGGADATATGIAVFLAPPTGSQTFAHSFDAATTEGPTRVLTFLAADNSVTLRGSLQAANASASSAVGVTLSGLTAGDLALAHDQRYGSAPANQTSWTSHATGTVNSEGYRVRSIAASGSSVTATAQGPYYSTIAAGAFYDAGGGGSDPTITDVDTDEIVLDGQTGVAVTGTDLGTTNADRTFTLRQGSTSVPQTETGTGTATAATLTIGIEQSGADIKFGAATLRATRTSDSAFGELAITVNPPTGQIYVDVGTPDTTAANRITAVADIASGDQLQARGEGGGAAPAGLNLEDDGTFWFEDGETPTAFDVRVWDASDATWGAWATQGIAGAAAEEGDLSAAAELAAGFDGRVTARATLTASVSAASVMLARADAVALLSAGLTASAVLQGLGDTDASMGGGLSLDAGYASRAAAIAQLAGEIGMGVVVTARATARATLTAGLAAGDSEASSGAQDVAISAELVVDALMAAVAAAQGAITAGLEAGESWAAQAQALVTLAAGAELDASFTALTSGTNTGLLSAQTAHAATFLAAANTLATLTGAQQLGAAIGGLAITLGQLAAGVELGAAFAYSGTGAVQIVVPAALGAAFDVAAQAIGVIVGHVGVEALIGAQAVTRAQLSAGVAFGSAFSAVGGLGEIFPPADRVLVVSPRVRHFVVAPRSRTLNA